MNLVAASLPGTEGVAVQAQAATVTVPSHGGTGSKAYGASAP